jgi:hypothetical protein
LPVTATIARCLQMRGQPRHQLVLRQIETCNRLAIVAVDLLLWGFEPPDQLINCVRVQITQGLDRCGDLLEFGRQCRKESPHNLLLLVLEAENRQLVGDPNEARAEVVDRFTSLERERVELALRVLAFALRTRSTPILRSTNDSHAAFAEGLLAIDPISSGGTALAITSNAKRSSV